ncbi:SAM-dependent methyltransferase [Streptomyces sp. NPDC057702]|uniref:SAM-dependent methyltransferase n=1 Tax=unclassified Streptomyces TaxID=2593676 RepID=UPI0036B0AA2D
MTHEPPQTTTRDAPPTPTTHPLPSAAAEPALTADRAPSPPSPAPTAQGLAATQGKAHSARMYDYFLGGKDNYPPDWEAAERVLEALPTARTIARTNRAFVHRTVEYLTRTAGVTQFLDIGTGIPTEPNLHQVAQGAAPQTRVVYVDNDPIVLSHARALLRSTPQGRTSYLHGDLREPAAILASREVRETLDLSRPVALTLISVLHFLPAGHDPYTIVRELLRPLPAGSYLALSYATTDFAPQEMARAAEIYRRSGVALRQGTKADAVRFFDGLDLVEPGVAPIHRWRPDPGADVRVRDADISMYGGVARKP